MSRYNKLWGALIGNLVAIALAYLATYMPELAQCVPVEPVEPPLDANTFEQVCSIAGFSQAQVTGFLMAAFNTAFVYAFPPNSPPSFNYHRG